MGGTIVSYVTNKLLLRFSHSLGIRNRNDVFVRWSNESKPSLGGLSFFIVFLFSAFAYSVIFSNDNIFQNSQYVGLFVAAALAFAMGLADDAYNTRPFFKLFIQILCGFILVWSNSIIGITDNYYVNAGLTIFFIAWIGQFYGHKIEGKKPSFLKDIQFLLIGPLWLMHFIYKKAGIRY